MRQGGLSWSYDNDNTNVDGSGKLDLVVVGMKMIWPETPWWEDDAVRINDKTANCGFAFIFWGRERREEAGEGERARGREACKSLFFQLLFYGFQLCSFFSESNASQETMPISVLLLSHVSSTWQITAKFLLGNQVRKLGSQVRTWQSLCAELVESIPSQKNLAEN